MFQRVLRDFAVCRSHANCIHSICITKGVKPSPKSNALELLWAKVFRSGRFINSYFFLYLEWDKKSYACGRKRRGCQIYIEGFRDKALIYTEGFRDKALIYIMNFIQIFDNSVISVKGTQLQLGLVQRSYVGCIKRNCFYDMSRLDLLHIVSVCANCGSGCETVEHLFR
ncbi:hypothetical protein JHK87_012142 [Glycine soja]|nr:hypothetical protein JHK87_012142 [Glycine soja]